MSCSDLGEQEVEPMEKKNQALQSLYNDGNNFFSE